VDNRNLFETRTTYRLLRAEYLVALVVCAVLLVLHRDAVRWWAFAVLFLYIDVIGYLPGALAHRMAQGARISKGYYVLYNCMHSLLSAALVGMLWVWLVGPEWALLALPLHLFGDRAIFGNFLKPFGVGFEPAVHPDFGRFEENYASALLPQSRPAEK
jgi:hypothetical protein